MSSASGQAPSAMKVAAAFATVYLVWGSTYFFIRLSVEHIPPMLVGAFRYVISGLLMLLWCVFTGERVFSRRVIRPAVVSGLLLLLGGNGLLIWAEQYVPSSVAAILLSSGPIWFVVLDRGKWRENFRSKATIAGLIVGTIGVLLLFGERLVSEAGELGGQGRNNEMVALAVLVLASISWAAGSLYSKYKSAGNSNAVNAGWQMMAAGLGFVVCSILAGEWGHFRPQAVPALSWISIVYLVIMGSLVGYSAYTWLLQVRPAAQVSTHAYVNPVVAVLLGVIFIGERLSWLQLLGLMVILCSVLLINLAKYRQTAGQRAYKLKTG
ncbi:MAG TPA: EamA family transporter [Puia sp.]|jgi:drug/metabolite transporter (DMT)-like permease|nr:EamA family transporter [Puia sp.]